MCTTRWIAVAAAIGLLAVALVGGSAARRLGRERDAARMALADVRDQLANEAAARDFVTDRMTSYQDAWYRSKQRVREMQSQVEWDKSHLLDCWTVIVRLLPDGAMPAIFGDHPGYLVRAARDGGSVPHYVRRCASDAVP